MIRLISLLFGLLLLSSTQVFASELKQQEMQNVNSMEEIEKEFNFNDSSYITDEQLQQTNDFDKAEEKTSFFSKIIDSGYFTSQTASKTYIPVNKIMD